MKTKAVQRPDLRVADHGSIFLLSAVSEAGRQWIADHIPEDAQRLGAAIAVEHRYILDIVQGAMNDDLLVTQ